jgi:ATP-dependent Clp protease adapter protein ClpS
VNSDADLTKKRFVVCIDEIRQNFVFGEEFTGRYTKTVTLSDGSTRTIELTPIIHEGMPLVELKDTDRLTYMGLNGTTINGTLMVQILDLGATTASHAQSPMLPPDTSLVTLPDFVPPGFTHGIEILNDEATPMQFVVSILCAEVGLGLEDSTRTMVAIHTRGGALLSTPSPAEAERLAGRVAAEAARLGYPLVCRAVCIDSSSRR